MYGAGRQPAVAESASDAPTWFEDQDQDGYGNDDTTLSSCAEPAGCVATGADCDDLDSAAGTVEIWFVDDDGDDWGSAEVVTCDPPIGTAAQGRDCDDTLAVDLPRPEGGAVTDGGYAYGGYGGGTLADAGDIDGDGTDDLLIGSGDFSSGAYPAWLWLGSHILQ